jgi:catechol 2,3-dioxygenase-like lactoylglutathione lyase family enzyme
MPARGIQHVDLAVSDVDRSLAFYKDLLGPLGLQEEERYPTYRGTGAIGSTTRRSRTVTSPATTRSSSSVRMDSASRSFRPVRNGPRASTGQPTSEEEQRDD